MRKLFYWAFAFSLCVLMGCKDDGVRVEVVRYAINEPVFMSISEFRNSVKVTDEVVPITKRGKICFYKDYLYISSPDKGIPKDPMTLMANQLIMPVWRVTT
uniref:hypothetical protein n=1 Tax=Parabacteroides distasonis TaxID=823 RepID=UPI00402750B3